MSSLPRISGRECVKALAKAGFTLRRQHGSYMILRRDKPFTQEVVPDHKELDRGTYEQLSNRQTSVLINSVSYCNSTPLSINNCKNIEWKIARLTFE